jgi:hypothetical protein
MGNAKNAEICSKETALKIAQNPIHNVEKIPQETAESIDLKISETISKPAKRTIKKVQQTIANNAITQKLDQQIKNEILKYIINFFCYNKYYQI